MKIVTKQIFIYSGILVIYFAVMVMLICNMRQCCAKTVACQTIMPEVEQPNISKNFAAPDTCLSEEQDVERTDAVDSLTCQCAVREDAKAEIVSQVPCECVEDIGNNITIWLGVIGAICTILPVVLSLKQTFDIQQMMDQLRKEADADKKKLEEEMSKHQEEMRAISDEYKRTVEEEIGNLQKDMEDKLSKEMHLHTISYLDRLLLSVSHLCNIRDIKYKGDLPILSSPIIRPMLESIEENSKEAYKQYCDIQDKCSIEQNKVIFYAALEALNSIRNLAQIYEDVVDVETMVQLQSLKDSISVYLKRWNEKTETLENKTVLDPDEPLSEVKLVAQKIHRIIFDELKRLEKEKKEKENKVLDKEYNK